MVVLYFLLDLHSEVITGDLEHAVMEPVQNFGWNIMVLMVVGRQHKYGEHIKMLWEELLNSMHHVI